MQLSTDGILTFGPAAFEREYVVRAQALREDLAARSAKYERLREENAALVYQQNQVITARNLLQIVGAARSGGFSEITLGLGAADWHDAPVRTYGYLSLAKEANAAFESRHRT